MKMMAQQSINEGQVVSKHNIIVIGAGLGGLGAACQAALAGEDVLLLEKHNVPGGFATSFVRGRFEFEGALHELSNYGTEEVKGGLRRFFEKIGLVPNKVQFKNIKEIYRSVFLDGYDVTMPMGVENYTNKLVELFPEEKKGIEEFMDVAYKVQQGMRYVQSTQGKATPAEILKEHPWLARVSGLTTQELFDKFIKNKRLIAVLAQLWGYAGLPPSKLNALMFVLIIISYLTEGAAFPVGRSHAMTSGLVKCFEEMGGEVKYNATVNRILVEDGKVVGVQLLNGETYKCKGVISNVNPICTTMKMLPLEEVSDNYMKKIHASEIGPSGFSVYIGLNASPKELGMKEHEIFINKGDNVDEAYQQFMRLESPEFLVAACYNNAYEGISPSGTTSLVLTTLQYGKLWHSVSPDNYFKIKDKIADGMISMVEKTICPNLRDYIEVAEAATPLTYYRYSKNMDGAIYGYVQDVINSPRFRLNSKGAIPGLFLAGAWVNIGGGFSPCINSGRIAAGMCLNYLNKEV